MWFITENYKCKLTCIKDLKTNIEVCNKLYGRKPCTLRIQDNKTCYEIDFDSNETGESVVIR